jgi:hypothetical protein
VKRIAKRWAISILVLIALFAVALTWRYERQERAREKREAEYELARRRYSAALKLGMSRKEVQEYFRENSVIASPRSWDELLIEIGREDPPWFCSARNVFVNFQFEHQDKGSFERSASDSDVLTAVTTLYWLDGCL